MRAAYAETKSETMVHGVFQKIGRGLTNFFVQEDYTKDIKKADIMRGKTKAAALEGDIECLDLVTFSVYGTKPVHFLSMAAEKLMWNINEKEIYYKATKKKISI